MTDAPVITRQQTFRYRAIEAVTGRVRQGEQSGESAYAVRASLRRIGLQVEALDPVGVKQRVPTWAQPLVASWHARTRRTRKLVRADLFDALATLVNAGLPLEQAVGQLAMSQTRSRAERTMLRGLRDRLREGVPLSDACEESPSWFDALDVAMLRTGQQAGDLSGVLISLAEFHQQSGAIGQKLFVALAYPVVLLAFGLIAVVFLSIGPLPKLLALITQAHQPPPPLTVHLVWLGQTVAHWWPLILVGIVALIAGLAALVHRTPRTGFLGAIIHGNLIARARQRGQIAGLAFTLARLQRSGMPLLEAIEATAQTADAGALRQLLVDSAHAIRRGEDFSSVVGASPMMEPEFAQLLQLGERSGELTTMLERIAERYARTAHRTIERVATLLGPLAIVVLAMLIGIIALAAILPIVQLGDLV
ncbi:MAG: type II secretion system F family protein [Planctomycetes bacterium]|nr:type II secretion system F family protein [Planctomycetota bacterium]